MERRKESMAIDSRIYRVLSDKKVDLSEWPTTIDPYYRSTKEYKEILRQHMEKLSSLQQLHYASNQHALPPIFQGMDSAGKDGAIRHVMSGVNPEGCEVFASSSQAPRSLSMIFSGAPLAVFPNDFSIFQWDFTERTYSHVHGVEECCCRISRDN